MSGDKNDADEVHEIVENINDGVVDANRETTIAPPHEDYEG